MPTHLRIARPVANLDASVSMYAQGLGLEILGSFKDHEGFDGTMLGYKDEAVHFEFTVCHAHPIPPSPTTEDLLVFYEPDFEVWANRCQSLRAAGFKEVESFNPYWAQNGRSFEDPDGYRVVIQRASWSNG